MDRQRVVAQMKALGEPNRLDLFLQLAGGEMGGSDLLHRSGLSQPSLSRHIRVLREAGVILERWAGRSAYYRLSDEPLVLSIVGIAAGVGFSPGTSGGGEGSGVRNMSNRESKPPVAVLADPEEGDVASPPMEDWLL